MTLLPIAANCRARKAKRSASIPSTGRKIIFMTLVILTEFLAHHHDILVYCLSPPSPRLSEACFDANATNSFIYKRLRFDYYFMQVHRRYQKYLAADEWKETIEVNQTLWSVTANKSEGREIKLKYYLNSQVEATDFTYNDLVFEALDRAYLSRFMPAYVYNYNNKEDKRKATDPRLESRSKCDEELSILVEQLHEIERARDQLSEKKVRQSLTINHELLAFFDVLANEESGLLLGNYDWTGNNWRECSKRVVFNVNKTNSSNLVKFTGRYCSASLKSSNWDTKMTERAQELKRIDYFKYPSHEYDYKRFHRVQVGICLPQSCNSEIISSRNNDVHKLATFKLSYPVRSYNLVDLYCLPDETSELRQLEPAGELFIFLAIVWLSLILLATYYDRKISIDVADAAYPKSLSISLSPLQRSRQHFTARQKFVTSLSLMRNFQRLTETKLCEQLPPLSSRLSHLGDEDSKIGAHQQNVGQPIQSGPKLLPEDLLFLNFVKVFSSFMIVFGHTGMHLKQLDKFVLDFDCQARYLNAVQLSTVFYVDIFFVISSFLTAYTMFVSYRVARNSYLDWSYSVFHRYWRLAPTYIIMSWYSKSLHMHAGSGPLWDYGASNMTFRSVCRHESYWYPLTLTANFYPMHKECIMPAWSISSEQQFYLIVPFLLVLLHKSALLGWLVISGAIGGSIALHLHRYKTDPCMQHLDLMRPRSDNWVRGASDLEGAYYLPQYRLSAYLIGLLAGHYTYMVLSGKWRSAILSCSATLLASKSESSRRSQHEFSSRSASSKRLIAAIFGTILMYVMLTAAYWVDLIFPTKLEPYAEHIAPVLYSLTHPTASLASALTFTTLMFGQWEPLRQFMSHPVWTISSRINYMLLIIQVEVITWVLQSDDFLIEFNTFALFKTLFRVIVIVYPLAAILSIVVEQPLAQLEQYFVAPLIKRWSLPSSLHQKQATELMIPRSFEHDS